MNFLASICRAAAWLTGLGWLLLLPGLAPAQSIAPNTTLEPWWEMFGDAQLTALETQALAANGNVRAALTRVEQSRATAQVAASYLFPSVRFNPGVYGTELAANRPVPFDVAASQVTQTQFYLPLEVSYEVDLWHRLGAGRDQALAEVAASEAASRALLLELTVNVASTYYSIRALDADLAVLDSALQLRRQNVAILQERLRVGLAPESEWRRSQTELANTQAEHLRVQNDRQVLEEQLTEIVGPSAGVQPLRVASAALQLPPVTVPTQLDTSWLSRRPDLARLRSLTYAAEAGTRAARAERLPRLDLRASAGPLSSQASTLLNYPGSRTWYAGAGVSVPVFEGGRNVARVRERQLAGVALTQEYAQRQRLALREANTALLRLGSNRQQLAAYIEAERAAVAVAGLSREQYLRGLVAFFDTVEAERTALQAARQVQQLRAALIYNTLDLVRAVAGGW